MRVLLADLSNFTRSHDRLTTALAGRPNKVEPQARTAETDREPLDDEIELERARRVPH